MSQSLKIRLAFDPFSKEPEAWTRVFELLEDLSRKNSTEVTPTYVVGSDLADWILYTKPGDHEEFLESIRTEMKKTVSEVDSKNLLGEPDTLSSRGLSRRSDVQTLMNAIAKDDVLVINTHGRTGLDRFFLGSFAETVLLQTKKPTFFVSPKMKPIGEMKRVFFPTDLSQSARVVFDHFLKQKFNPGKEIIIYSKAIHPGTVMYSGFSPLFGAGAVSVEDFLKEQQEEKQAEAKEWQKNATAAGFDCRIVLDDQPGPIRSRIVQVADEMDCHLIAMPSFASQLDTVVAGSTAREVVRQSAIPVLTWHVQRDDDKVTLDAE